MTYIHHPEASEPNPRPGTTLYTICPACSMDTYRQPWPCNKAVEERENLLRAAHDFGGRQQDRAIVAEEKLERLQEQVDQLSQFARCAQQQDDHIAHGGAAVCQACYNHLQQKLEGRELAVEALREALEAIGVLPDCYCFCPTDRRIDRPTHTGECVAANQALTTNPASDLQRLVRIGRRVMSAELAECIARDDWTAMDAYGVAQAIQAWLGKETLDA